MKSISKSIILLLFLCLYLVGIVFYYHTTSEENKNKIYQQLSLKLLVTLNYEEQLLKEIGVINAISISENEIIRGALIQNKREPAIKELRIINDNFAKNTSIKDLKVHIHTKNVRSFIRNWKLKKHGDDLSGFRKAIVKVRNTHELFSGFEAGRIGLTLRSIVPIMKNEKYIGSLEFIQSFENIIKIFKRKEYSYLLLMSDSLSGIAKYLKDAETVDKYIISSKKYDKEYASYAKTIDFFKLKKDTYLMSEKYFYTFEDVRDFENKISGMHLIAMPSIHVHKAIAESEKNLMITIAISSAFLFLLLAVFWLIAVLMSSAIRQK